MSYTKSRKGVIRRFEEAPENIKVYFRHAPQLLDGGYLYGVVLAWMFARLELAHNMAIYCGIVKLHRGDSTVTRNVLDTHHMTRDGFRKLFKLVFDRPLKKEIATTLNIAERIRDKTMHGKIVEDPEYRNAIVAVVDYAEAFNEFVAELDGFPPFGDLRGFKGRGQSLDKKTTQWVLRGMGVIKSTKSVEDQQDG